MSETSKTPNFDEWKESSDGILDEAVAKDIAALEARHAEEMRTREDSYLVALGQKSNRIDDQAEELEKLSAELCTLRAKLATMVCGTCRGTGCTHGHRGCTCHPCPVCQPAKEGK